MNTLLNNTEFKDILGKRLSGHETNILVGQIIKEKYPKPLIAFPDAPRDSIAKMLIATCSTEKEITDLMLATGLGDVSVSVMEEPTDEAGKECKALCIAMGAELTKEGLPCMIMFYEDHMDDIHMITPED